jgi:hypothetical protein
MKKQGKKFMATPEGDKTRSALKRIAKRTAKTPIDTKAQFAVPLISERARAPAATPHAMTRGKLVVVAGIDHKPTPAQELMIADGMPRELAQSIEQRQAANALLPPPKPVAFDTPQRKEVDPSTERFLAELAAQKTAEAEQSTFIKAKREARANKPKRASRDGMITIAAVAAELKILPREARAVLRSLKIAKPPQGWAFDAKTAASIKRTIEGELKCASSVKTTKAKATSSKPRTASSKSSPASRASSPQTKSKRSSKKGKSSAPRSRNTGKR